MRMRRIAAVLGAGLLSAALTASAAGAAGTTTTTAPHKPKAVHTKRAPKPMTARGKAAHRRPSHKTPRKK
jgi:hypothetical protein